MAERAEAKAKRRIALKKTVGQGRRRISSKLRADVSELSALAAHLFLHQPLWRPHTGSRP